MIEKSNNARINSFVARLKRLFAIAGGGSECSVLPIFKHRLGYRSLYKTRPLEPGYSTHLRVDYLRLHNSIKRGRLSRAIAANVT